MRILWTEHVHNEEVLWKMGIKITFLLKIRNVEFYGDIGRKEGLESLSLTYAYYKRES